MEKNKNKVVPIIGMIVGFIAIILGILVLIGVFTDKTSIAYPSYFYDYGYAQFGSDYYSYTNNNMAYAAYSSSAAFNQTLYLTNLVSSIAGFSFILFGAITSLVFATKIPSSKKQDNELDVSCEN